MRLTKRRLSAAWRRALAALVAGVTALAAFLALSPPDGPRVLVAARDLAPGVLRPGDLRLAPMHDPPDGVLRSGAEGARWRPPCGEARR
ncbi:hypothetical protein OIE66_00955 [Nonomuraea sp. NBC_01738]|uniref:hypothetical protein n=1 Tax=Nonomuraea sp. NBC_01738 TaxID=2976003 RepID=UPI002E114405|nr:hypothetical protein OIE66_00955 [Nonomuraea sp. NBC_01738]